MRSLIHDWDEMTVKDPQEPAGGAASSAPACAVPMEIPVETWGEFFKDLSGTHVDVPMTVQIRERDSEPRELAKDMTLVGIAVEVHGNDRQVEIILGDDPNSYAQHTVHNVQRICICPGEGERESLLQIEAPDRGEVTELRWREP